MSTSSADGFRLSDILFCFFQSLQPSKQPVALLDILLFSLSGRLPFFSTASLLLPLTWGPAAVREEGFRTGERERKEDFFISSLLTRSENPDRVALVSSPLYCRCCQPPAGICFVVWCGTGGGRTEISNGRWRSGCFFFFFCWWLVGCRRGLVSAVFCDAMVQTTFAWLRAGLLFRHL